MTSSISNSDSPRFMRQWVLSLIACLLIAVSAFVAITEWIVRTRVLPVDPFEQSLRVFAQATSPNAVFGDSIVARGFLERPDFVNLAYPADSWEMIEIKARSYFDTRQPGRIILAASHTELRHATVAARDTGVFNHEGYHHIFQERRRAILTMLEPYHRQRILAYWLTLFTKGAFVPAVRILDGGGMISTDPTESAAWAAKSAAERESLGQLTAAREAPPEHLTSTAGATRFRNLVTDLKRRGARVCIVRFPASREFRATATGIPSYKAAKNWFYSLAEELDLTFVDLWGAYDADVFFADPTHMSPEGGREAAAAMVRACFGD